MVFTIKQNSTHPVLLLRLYRDGRNEYRNFEDKLERAAITFSMKDVKTGNYKIANKPGKVYLKTPSNENGKKEYYIGYDFSKSDTDKSGMFYGEFKIIFLSENLEPKEELIVPISEDLQIHVIESFVKSDVVFS